MSTSININKVLGSTSGTSITITTGGTPPPPVAPTNTIAPVVTGTPAVGSVLTTSNGTWINGPTSFTYQWWNIDTALPIVGATSFTYTLQQTDANTEIYCQVTGTNIAGSGTGNSNSFYIYDADYYTVYTTIGIVNVASYAQSKKQNLLMLEIKHAGVWAKLDTFFVFATDGDEYYAALDWKNPAQFSQNLGCFFTANQGFTGNGTASFDTGFDPYNMGLNYQQDNASRYFFPYYLDGGGPMDGTNNSIRNSITVGNTTDNYINQDALPLLTPFYYTNTVEPKSIHRFSVTSIRLYNGTVADNRTVFSATPIAELQQILTSNGIYATHTVSGYAMGASMIAENTAFVTAWNTYIASL